MLSVGLDNLIVAATSDGILVSDKDKAQFIKTHVEEMNQRPMYEERKWGVFRVLDYQEDSEGEKALTKELILKPNKAISYQRHQHRKEVWTVINGKGILLIEGKEREVKTGDVITIDPFAMHAIKAITELHIIEVQLGEILDEKDIQKFSWEWS